MKPNFLLILSFSALFLAGCSNQASFSEKMQDSFLLTSAENVSKENMQCIKLTQAYTLHSGLFSYTFPAGNYVGMKKNSTGVFYYSTKPIQSNAGMLNTVQGIYLDNNAKKGHFFGYNPQGFPDRPIRSTTLPAVIFSNLQMNAACK